MPLTENDPSVDSRQASTMQYKPLLKRFALRLCVVVTLCVGLLVAVEIYSYLRYTSAAGDVMELAVKLELAQNESPAEHEYWKEFAQANKITYHPWVLWRRQPYQGELISIDENGVRRTLHTRCDDKALTIWMFGDSVMWGAGAPDTDTIPTLVAADYEKAGRPACIVNYAEKGWSSTQEMIGLMEELKHTSRKPDLVLFYDGGTEAFTALQSRQVDVHSNFASFKNFLDKWSAGQKAHFSYLSQTNTYHLLDKISAKGLFHRKPVENAAAGPDPTLMADDVVHNYVQNMEIINALGKQFGFRAIFAWYPNMAVGHKALTPYEQQVLAMENKKFQGMDAMYAAVYKRAHELNPPGLLYLGDLLDDQKDSLYVGISHLKPEGNQIVADRLFDILEHQSSPAQARASTPSDHGHGH
ncbi:MAG: SGNH/GDSL hydrolase family protein [Terriglobales bacterium]